MGSESRLLGLLGSEARTVWFKQIQHFPTMIGGLDWGGRLPESVRRLSLIHGGQQQEVPRGRGEKSRRIRKSI